MNLPELTVRTALGAADLEPCFRRDRGVKEVEVRDWERKPAALALAGRYGWSVDRIARATGLHAEAVRELLGQHQPAEAAPEPVATAAVAERPRLARPVYDIGVAPSSNRRKASGMDWNTKERITALVSMNERKDGVIKDLAARLAEMSGELERARGFAISLEQENAEMSRTISRLHVDRDDAVVAA